MRAGAIDRPGRPASLPTRPLWRGFLMGFLVAAHVALVAWVAMPPGTRGVEPGDASANRLQMIEVVPVAVRDVPAAPRYPRAGTPDVGTPRETQPRRSPAPDAVAAQERVHHGVDEPDPDRGIDEWARSSGAAPDAVPGFRQPRDRAAGASLERPAARIPGREEAFVEGIRLRATLTPEAVVNGVGQFLFGRPRPETCGDIRQRLIAHEPGVAREIDLDKLRRLCSS